jgi:vancomycin resistance protein VanJ
MRRLFTLSVTLASFALLMLLLTVRLGSWSPRWWLDALDTFALYAFMPFLGTMAATLVLRSRMLAVITVCALAFFVQQFGAQLASSLDVLRSAEAETAAPAGRLRVLTLNAHSSYDDAGPLVELLARWQPDVVVMQEVARPYVEVVQPSIGVEYPFSFTVGLDTDHQGSATWSRVPMGDAQPLQLSHDGNLLQRVRVSTGAGEIWIYNVHLANPTGSDQGDGRLRAIRRFDSDERDHELARLVKETTGLGTPFVLAGDFNIASGSRTYRSLPTMWRDAFAEAGRGFGHTYPAPAHEQEGDDWLKIPFPLLRIDYILTSSDLRPRRAWTQEVHGSDHLAVIADFEPTSAR